MKILLQIILLFSFPLGAFESISLKDKKELGKYKFVLVMPSNVGYSCAVFSLDRLRICRFPNGPMWSNSVKAQKLYSISKDTYHQINNKDVVIGIAASGTTPYVIGALEKCNENGIITGCIVCNSESSVADVAQYPVEVIVGSEFVTGSTRMKSGTAQKLVLNMISTTVMIKLGKVVGNKMVDMQLSNNKLVDRGTKMIMGQLDVDYETANALLLKYGSVRKAIEAQTT